jgi:hypothetical protein
LYQFNGLFFSHKRAGDIVGGYVSRFRMLFLTHSHSKILDPQPARPILLVEKIYFVKRKQAHAPSSSLFNASAVSRALPYMS